MSVFVRMLRFEERQSGRMSLTKSLQLTGQTRRVRSENKFLVGPQEPLLATVRRRKLAWFGHVTRHDSLSKPILQGTLDNGRRRVISRGNTGWTVKGWTSLPIAELFTLASGRKDWKSVSTEMSLIFLPTIYLVEGLNRIELYQM